MYKHLENTSVSLTDKLPIPYLNGDNFCEPLGDLTVWGSLYNLTEENTASHEVIMLATKVSLQENSPADLCVSGK